MKRLAKIVASGLLVILALIVIYYLYDLLREKSNAEKLADIIHEEDRRNLSKHLLAYLDDPDEEIRARAALAIGRIGGVGTGKSLMAMIFDSSLEVASSAAFAIGLTGEKSYAGMRKSPRQACSRTSGEGCDR